MNSIQNYQMANSSVARRVRRFDAPINFVVKLGYGDMYFSGNI